jgi:hypothetical protein
MCVNSNEGAARIYACLRISPSLSGQTTASRARARCERSRIRPPLLSERRACGALFGPGHSAEYSVRRGLSDVPEWFHVWKRLVYCGCAKSSAGKLPTPRATLIDFI